MSSQGAALTKHDHNPLKAALPYLGTPGVDAMFTRHYNVVSDVKQDVQAVYRVIHQGWTSYVLHFYVVLLQLCDVKII